MSYDLWLDPVMNMDQVAFGKSKVSNIRIMGSWDPCCRHPFRGIAVLMSQIEALSARCRGFFLLVGCGKDWVLTSSRCQMGDGAGQLTILCLYVRLFKYESLYATLTAVDVPNRMWLLTLQQDLNTRKWPQKH